MLLLEPSPPGLSATAGTLMLTLESAFAFIFSVLILKECQKHRKWRDEKTQTLQEKEVFLMIFGQFCCFIQVHVIYYILYIIYHKPMVIVVVL